MSRSGYSDDGDFLDLYRETVRRALNGKRGQQFLREMLRAFDALSEKRLIAGELINVSGECCAIGAVCKSRSMDVTEIDYDDSKSVAGNLGIAPAMAAEIAYMNDEYGMLIESPEDRFARMRQWVKSKIIEREDK